MSDDNDGEQGDDAVLRIDRIGTDTRREDERYMSALTSVDGEISMPPWAVVANVDGFEMLLVKPSKGPLLQLAHHTTDPKYRLPLGEVAKWAHRIGDAIVAARGGEGAAVADAGGVGVGTTDFPRALEGLNVNRYGAGVSVGRLAVDVMTLAGLVGTLGLLARPPAPAEGAWVWNPEGGAWMPEEPDLKGRVYERTDTPHGLLQWRSDGEEWVVELGGEELYHGTEGARSYTYHCGILTGLMRREPASEVSQPLELSDAGHRWAAEDDEAVLTRSDEAEQSRLGYRQLHVALATLPEAPAAFVYTPRDPVPESIVDMLRARPARPIYFNPMPAQDLPLLGAVFVWRDSEIPAWVRARMANKAEVFRLGVDTVAGVPVGDLAAVTEQEASGVGDALAADAERLSRPAASYMADPPLSDGSSATDHRASIVDESDSRPPWTGRELLADFAVRSNDLTDVQLRSVLFRLAQLHV